MSMNIDRAMNRLLSKVTFQTEEPYCWRWTGKLSKEGWGRIRVGEGRQVLAHVLSYELHKGSIPQGHLLKRICSNRDCVNPKHLRAIPRAEYSKEYSMYASKLTEQDVKTIRSRLSDTNTMISMNYDVSPKTIDRIRKGETWKRI